ncbi:unnamed protein product [Mytilus coruscus]|uniref:Reverse transcriptase domain-containing protein n=1 Tax=Mytilus coruscus TaxID=42192 RepID=A0A6J8A1M4_MYTCO|nr:unnamed protein product [Mytilus coruscus]
MEEYERENKDLKKPTLFGMLDAKSAFDVVRHTNLIRELYHMGISEQCILLIDNLYKEATTKIKWKGQISGAFDIEQGVRQGGTLSADLYKVYVNQLLDNLNESNICGKIGPISCCAPTCADDIALLGDIPLDLQILINIAFDYSQRKGYLLHPEKSVVLPVLTSKKVTYEEEKSFMRDKQMPVVNKTSHIGIQRDSRDTTASTIEENLKKARRTLYSLMHQELHGENGLDPITSVSLLQTFVYCNV